MGDKPPAPPPPAAEVRIAVHPELLRKARVRAFELGTTLEKVLARLVGHLAKEQDQQSVLMQQSAPAPKPRREPAGQTGERVELRRPALPPRTGRSGRTG